MFSAGLCLVALILLGLASAMASVDRVTGDNRSVGHSEPAFLEIYGRVATPLRLGSTALSAMPTIEINCLSRVCGEVNMGEPGQTYRAVSLTDLLDRVGIASAFEYLDKRVYVVARSLDGGAVAIPMGEVEGVLVLFARVGSDSSRKEGEMALLTDNPAGARYLRRLNRIEVVSLDD